MISVVNWKRLNTAIVKAFIKCRNPTKRKFNKLNNVSMKSKTKCVFFSSTPINERRNGKNEWNILVVLSMIYKNQCNLSLSLRPLYTVCSDSLRSFVLFTSVSRWFSSSVFFEVDRRCCSLDHFSRRLPDGWTTIDMDTKLDLFFPIHLLFFFRRRFDGESWNSALDTPITDIDDTFDLQVITWRITFNSFWSSSLATPCSISRKINETEMRKTKLEEI